MKKDYNAILNEVREKVQNKLEEMQKESGLKVTGTVFENIVFEALKEAGIEEEQITHSVRKFPDFIIEDKEKNMKIGLEVKKTDGNKWEIIGGSIYESLRNHIDETYVLMGKLGGNPEARLKKYVECIKDLKVTHSPRFELDLELEKNEDYLTKNNAKDILDLSEGSELDRRIRELLRTDKSTWYSEEMIISFSDLKREEKEKYFIDGVVLFPEVIGGDYSEFAKWMTYKCLVWCKNIRDVFSAGKNVKYNEIYISQMMKRMLRHKKEVFQRIKNMSEEEIETHWGNKVTDIEGKINIWCELVRKNIKLSKTLLDNNSKLERFQNMKRKNIECIIIEEIVGDIRSGLMKFV